MRVKRNIAGKLLAVILGIFTIFSTDSECVWAASASLNGQPVVRAGDTITLNLNISSDRCFGIEADISYDGNVVTLVGLTTPVSGWKLENNGSKVVVYDDALSNPQGGGSSIVTAKFKVNSVNAGTPVNISFSNIVVTDGTSESSAGTATYSTVVAPPLSGNNNLAALNIEGFDIRFAPDTTTYDLGTVEFDISRLNISANPQEQTASVSVGNSELSVGENNITVRVTAENGAEKTYNIRVTRKQDPNYVPGNNADLSSLNVSDGKLSPAFSPDITDYVVYLPYGTLSINIEGTAADAKAAPVVNASSDNLVTGDNKLVITGIAEDGTKKEYVVHVVVMPEYKGVLPEITGIDKVQEEPETETKAPLVDKKDQKDNKSDDSGVEVPLVAATILFMVAAAAGVLVTYIVLMKKNKKETENVLSFDSDSDEITVQEGAANKEDTADREEAANGEEAEGQNETTDSDESPEEK